MPRTMLQLAVVQFFTWLGSRRRPFAPRQVREEAPRSQLLTA